MRTIKFRAWDREEVRMWDDVIVTPRFVMLVTGTGAKTWPHKAMIPMQFTGLFDFNGKEIYEGDVVKTGDEYGEIQYDPDQAAFIILFQPHNKKQKSGCANLASTWPSPRKEIIGNIYENSELLTNEKNV